MAFFRVVRPRQQCQSPRHQRLITARKCRLRRDPGHRVDVAYNQTYQMVGQVARTGKVTARFQLELLVGIDRPVLVRMKAMLVYLEPVLMGLEPVGGCPPIGNFALGRKCPCKQ